MSPYGFVSAHVLEFKRVNRFIRLNLVHERSQIRKHSPKVNIYILIIAGRIILETNIYHHGQEHPDEQLPPVLQDQVGFARISAPS